MRERRDGKPRLAAIRVAAEFSNDERHAEKFWTVILERFAADVMNQTLPSERKLWKRCAASESSRGVLAGDPGGLGGFLAGRALKLELPCRDRAHCAPKPRSDLYRAFSLAT